MSEYDIRLQLLEELVLDLENKLKDRDIYVCEKKDISYGIQMFMEDKDGETLILNMYNGKDGFKFVPNKKMSPIYTHFLDCIEQKKMAPTIPFDVYIGTDESGKGDYFGPLIVAGFISNAEVNQKLFSYGIRDCKNIGEKQILELGEWLYREYASHIATCILLPEQYNIQYSHYKLERKNVNDLLAWGHAQVIEKLADHKLRPMGVIADQFGSPKHVMKALMEKGSRLEIMQTTRAEKDMAVAAASVVAKYNLLKYFDEVGRQYDVVIPRGSGIQAIDCAIDIANRYGVMELKKNVKIHFRITKEVLKVLNKNNQDIITEQ